MSFGKWEETGKQASLVMALRAGSLNSTSQPGKHCTQLFSSLNSFHPPSDLTSGLCHVSQLRKLHMKVSFFSFLLFCGPRDRTHNLKIAGRILDL